MRRWRPNLDDLPWWARYAAALAVTAAALIARLALTPLLGDDAPWMIFHLAVLVAALIGGVGPSLLAAVLGAVAVNYFWREPRFQVAIATPATWTQFGLFLLVATAINAVIAMLRVARARAVRSAEAAQRSEGALRESERRFRAVADSAPVLIWMSGLEKEGVFFNKTWLDFTGRPLDQELGWGWVEGIHPDDREAASQACGAGFKERRPFTTQFRLRRADQEYRWVHDTGVPRFNPDGSFAGYIGSCVDIHDRIRAQEALRQTNRTLEALIAASPLAIAVLDREARVRLWNAEAARLFGWTAQEVLGGPMPTIAPEQWGEFRCGLALTFQGRTLQGAERVRLRKDGARLDVAVWTALLRDAAGAGEAVLSMTADISQRVAAQDEIRKLNEGLERRVAERTAQLRALAGEMTMIEQRERRRIANALHDDLAQSLAICRMKLSMLARPGEQREARTLDEARDCLGAAITFARGLMHDLSPPMLYDLGLAAALGGLVERLEQQHGLNVRIETAGDEAAVSEDVRAFLFTSVRELLTNVVKYARTGEAKVTLTQAPRQVCVSVEDRGVGFDVDRLAWRPTERGGFGLFSIRERVELLGGYLELNSTPGTPGAPGTPCGGTRVTLVVPIEPQDKGAGAAEPGAEPALPAAPEGAQAATSGATPGATSGAAPGATPGATPGAAGGEGQRRTRIVLADDHEILREGLAGLLREQGDLEVVGQAADGLAAVMLARQLRPDVVVMDVSMPVLNGIEATRRITAELPQVRVIGLSMHEREGAAAMLEAGAAAYLTKGGPAEALIAAIRARAGEIGGEASFPAESTSPP